MSRRIALAALTGMLVGIWSAGVARAAGAQRAVDALADLERTADGPLAISISPTTGLATFIGAGEGRGAPIASRAAGADARALGFVAQWGASFGIADASRVRATRHSGPDAVGMEHVRLQQSIDGVPVRGGELTVHLRGGAVVAVLGRTVADADRVSTTPGIDAARAAAVAGALVAGLGAADAVLSTPGLELFNRGLLDGTRAATRLAWFVEASEPGRREAIWVDAQSAAVLLHFNQVTSALSRLVFDANNAGQFGPLVRSEGDPPTGDVQVDRVYDYCGDTYNYYLTVHGRDSYDDAGGIFVNYVRSCASALCSGLCPCPNAFNVTYASFFGDGWTTDDIVAHEWTHGVTAYAAALYYVNQSGALNESYSDIFGETVDLTNGVGTDTPAVRWLIGEDLFAIRNMMNPNAFGDPGKMSDSVACYDFDNGGVHTNSGIPNHAYALMVDGGTYNGFTVVGIGLTKAAKIEYRAENDYLISSATMLDDYNALNQACADLVGTAGITSADCAEVLKALDAVEMADLWPCAPPPVGLCQSAPQSGCRSAGTSSLLLKQAGGGGDKLVWKWTKGAATSLGEFGDPSAGTDYALCLYSGGPATLLAAYNVPAGPPWSAAGTSGFKYLDPGASADGIRKIVLKASAVATAKTLVKGAGSGLPDPALGGLPSPLTAQLVNGSTGVCWEATYSGPDIIKNDSDLLKAKSVN